MNYKEEKKKKQYKDNNHLNKLHSNPLKYNNNLKNK